MNESRLLEGLRGLLGNIQSTLVSMTTPTFSCSRGYNLASSGDGCSESCGPAVSCLLSLVSCLLSLVSCVVRPVTESHICVFAVVCPAGSFSREGACLLCAQGTYQGETGRGFCNKCPRGSSPAGASSVNQCESNSPPEPFIQPLC